MALIVLRLTLVPLTVLLASVVQRRLGPTIGGRVVGLPLTTGPFLFLLCSLPRNTASESAAAIGAQAAAGVVAGQLSVVGFCIAYGHLALGPCRARPGLALLGALVATAAGTAVSTLVPAPWALAALVLATLAISLVNWPATVGPPPPPRVARTWETPARMVLSGALVATLLGLAGLLGPHLAGVLATMPVILTVLAPTTHRGDGPTAAAALVRGALASMPASIVFAAVLVYTLVPLRPGVAFAVAFGALVLTDLSTTGLTKLGRRRADVGNGRYVPFYLHRSSIRSSLPGGRVDQAPPA